MVMIDEPVLTVRDVARQLRVTEYTVRVWLQTGRLKGFRPGGTKAGWRVKRSDLEAFIEASMRNREKDE